MKKNPSPPKHLTAQGKKLWRQLRDDYEIDDASGLLLLGTLCESHDRIEQLREILRREGVSVEDRFGQRRAHPLLAAERDARAALLAAVRALKLAPADLP